MVVDCHTHINCQASGDKSTELLEASEKVDVCIVLACPGSRSSKDTNTELAEYVGKHKGKMVGFGVVDAVCDSVGIKKLTAMRDNLGLKGIVLYCSQSGFHPAHSRAMRLYEAAEELDMPVFFHNAAPLSAEAVLDYAQPYLLDEVVRRFGSLKLVIGSMGMPFVEQTLCMVGKHENVYADLTISPRCVWQVYNVVVGAFEREVMGKLLFGSGFPFGDAGSCMEALLGFNKLLADINLPTVPRDSIRSIIERDTLKALGIEDADG